MDRARAAGDTIVWGGQRRSGSLHYEPTLIVPASNDAEIVQREVFGPVLTIQTFASEADAVELANSTQYGLSAIVYTGSSARAERVGAAVRAGIVWTKRARIFDPSYGNGRGVCEAWLEGIVISVRSLSASRRSRLGQTPRESRGT